MNRKYASLIFLTVSLILAILLITDTINPIMGGSFFAIALVILGLLSKGFQK